MTVLFTMMPLELAPRVGLGLAALLTLMAGMISLLRVGAPPPAAGAA
jgi:hypothetical protein